MDSLESLPFEVNLKIFSFLPARDRLHLAALSAVFRDIFYTQKKLNFRQAHAVSVAQLKTILSGFQAHSLVSLDLSYSYWIQSQFVKDAIQQFLNLRELYLLDIKLTFGDVIDIVGRLDKLTALSVSLTERSGKFLQEDDCQSFQLMERKILQQFPAAEKCQPTWGKLNKLTLHVYSFDYHYLLIILSWCVGCTDLSIILESCWPSTTVHCFAECCQVILDSTPADRLQWLAKVHSLVYVAPLRGYVELSIYKTLTWWVGSLANQVQRFLIPGLVLNANQLFFHQIQENLKAYVQTGAHLTPDLLLARRLQWLCGVRKLDRSLEELSSLRLFHGSFKDQQTFSSFCETHANLETLVIANSGFAPNSLRLEPLVNLHRLKRLALSPSLFSGKSTGGFENAVAVSTHCSGLKELHLFSFTPDRSDVGEIDPQSFVVLGDCVKKLRRLTLGGFTQVHDHSFITKLLQQNENLESLELIEGNNSYLGELHLVLPRLRHLVDLRLREVQLVGDDLAHLFEVVAQCDNLEKLALSSFGKFQPVPDYFATFPEQMERLVRSARRLVAFHVIVAVLSSEVCQETSDVLAKISQERILWYLITNRPVSVNDGSIPLSCYNSLIVSKDYPWVLPEAFL